MRKYNASYMLYMTKAEKDFITEMAWVQKKPICQYLRQLIREDMAKNQSLVKAIESRETG